jgi:hypothetical protein
MGICGRTIYSIYEKVKGKFNPKTDHESPENEQIYTSTLCLTSALEGVGSQRHAPAALSTGKTR